ncbi:MAG: hypothetical protein ABIO57_02625 [Candidatus Paceibacterota bacterium]
MKRENLLKFNLGVPYMDCLQSFKKELVIELTKDGRINREEIIIKEKFNNFEEGSSTLALNDRNLFDDLYICLKNRLSGINFSINELNVNKVDVTLKGTEEGDNDKAWSMRSLAEIITQGDIIELIIVWLLKAELTQWASGCFIVKKEEVAE